MGQDPEDQKEYLSLAEAARICPYSQEYLSLRARNGKLKAIKLGRNWVTRQEWVDEYVAKMQDYREELNDRIEKKEFEQVVPRTKGVEEGARRVRIKAREAKLKPRVSLPMRPKEVVPLSAFRLTGPPLRFGLAVGLAFLVLVVSFALGKGGFSGVFYDVKQVFSDIAQRAGVSLNLVAEEIKRGTADVSLVLDYSLFAEPQAEEFELAYPTTPWQETAHIFSSYFGWLREKFGNIFASKPKTVALESDVNRMLILEAKIETLKELFSREEYTQRDVESLKEEITELKEYGLVTKEIITEIQKITQIIPKEIIEKQVMVIDLATTEELKQLKQDLAAIQQWETDIARLQRITEKLKSAPTNQVIHPTAPIYIASQGLQVGGNATFASLGISGSGSATNFSVGDNMQIGTESADVFTVLATSIFESPISAQDRLYVGPNTELTIDSSGNIDTSGTITAIGNISAQDLTLTGDLTVAGSQTYFGVASITASSTSAALLVNQTGSGNVATFQQGGSDKLIITNSGNVGIGTTTPSTPLHVVGTSTLGVITGATIDTSNNTITINEADINDGSIYPRMSAAETITGGWTFGTASTTLTGPLLFSGDNTIDIGASGASRPRTGYFGTSVIVGDSITINTNTITGSGTTTITTLAGNLSLTPTANLILDSTGGTIDIDDGTLDFSTQTVDITLNNAQDALNFDSNTLSIDALNNRVGMGTTSPSYSLDVDGTFRVTGNLIFGESSTDTVVFNTLVASDIIPNDNSRYLGTTDNRWAFGYFDEIQTNLLAAASTTISGTRAQAFTINSDNSSDDTEDAFLTFERGTPITNASLKWNAAAGRFEFLDFPLLTESDLIVSGSSTTTGAAVFQSSLTQSGGNVSLATTTITGDLTVNTNQLYVDTSSGFVGIGTTSPSQVLTVGNADQFTVTSAGAVDATSLTLDTPLADAEVSDTLTCSVVSDADKGDIVISSGSWTLDADVVAAAEMADADHGDVSWSGGVASVQDLTITSEATGDILYYTGSAWARIATGTDAYVLTMSSDVPAWAAAAGGGEWTDGGTTLYPNEINDNVSIGTTTENARLTVQSTSTTDILNLFETSGTEVFTVLESGNVGIGTTNPLGKLDMYAGDGNVDQTIYIRTDEGNSSFRVQSNRDTAGNLLGQFEWWGLDSTSTSTRYVQMFARLDDTTDGSEDGSIHFRPKVAGSDTYVMSIVGGNVGIGTTSPGARLHVQSADVAPLRIDSTAATGGGLQLQRNGTTFGAIYTQAGIIGSGTSTDLILFSETGNAIGFASGGSATRRMTIDTSGNVSLGVFSQPGSDPMCWDGSAPSIIGDCSSLREHKEDIEELQLGLETVLQMQPRAFYWKQPTSTDNVVNPYQDLGFIAEEVEEISPLLTTHRDGELVGVRYRQYTSVLTNAIQDIIGVVDITDAPTSSPSLIIDANGNIGIGLDASTTPSNILTIAQNSATDPIADAWTVYSTPDSKVVLGAADDQTEEYLEKFKDLPVYKWKRNEDDEVERLGVLAEASTPSEILAYDAEGNIQGIDLGGYIGFLHETMKGQQSKIEELEQKLLALTVAEDPETGEITYNYLADIVPQVQTALASLGLTIDEQGALVVDSLKAGELEVGTQTQPTGITLYDEETGEAYCLKIKGGTVISGSGECSPGEQFSGDSSPNDQNTGGSQQYEQLFYYDNDGDGYGTPNNYNTGSQPEGYVPNNNDCNDFDASINPSAEEICDDGIDNNCDGEIDEGCATSTEPVATTTEPIATSTEPVCQPSEEICDGLDNNCDGQIDENCDCGQTFCDASINLVGDCVNPCMGELGCGICEPSCGCAEGWSDCDNDLTNGCETQGECVVEEPEPAPEPEPEPETEPESTQD